MSVTLYKLSWRNARRQARDYLVYFVTIVMAAALIYAFNGLVFSREIADLSEKLASLPLMIVLASAAAVLITGWLVSYTTGFMLLPPQPELGTYILIGWSTDRCPGCFFWKTGGGRRGSAPGAGGGGSAVSGIEGCDAGSVRRALPGLPGRSRPRRWG